MRTYLLLFLLTIPLLAFSQEEGKSKPIFNEFYISANRTIVADATTDGGYGFGAGAYKSWFNDKEVNLLLGIEYTRTSLYKEGRVEASHFSSFSNATFYINSVSIPVNLRFNLGSKKKLFIEAGTYVSFIGGGTAKGTARNTNITQLTDSTWSVTTSETEVKKAADLYSLNVGLMGGFGLRVPLRNHEMLFKLDYRYGINDISNYNESIYNQYLRFSVGLKI